MKSARDETTEPRPGQDDRSLGLRAMGAAHRPAVSVAGPYGHPFHPMLAAVPIGAWVCTVALDFASKISEGRAYARPAVWLCAIGIVSAVVAAIAGLIDFRRLTAGTKAHATAVRHLVLMSSALVLFILSFIFRRSESSSITYLADGTPVAAMVLSIIGLGLLAVGGWLGGRLVYTYGVRVADESDQLAGHVPNRSDLEKFRSDESDTEDASGEDRAAVVANRDESTS